MIRIEHEKLGRLYYKDEVAYEEGDFFVSVTTVLGIIMDKGLEDFFVNTKPDAIRAIRASTSKAGTDLHTLVENDLSGKDVVPTDKQAKFYDLWGTMKHTHNIEATHTEQTLHHDLFGFCGTADVIGNFTSCDSKGCCFYEIDGPAVMDLKTGRSYKIQSNWQIAAYRAAAIHMGLVGEDCGGVGLHIIRDGSKSKTFTMKHLDPCFETFLHALQVWKFLNFNILVRKKWKYLKQDALKILWEGK